MEKITQPQVLLLIIYAALDHFVMFFRHDMNPLGQGSPPDR